MAHLSIAVLTVSDTRTRETDTSGDLLASYIETDRHNLIYRSIVHDDIYDIRAIVSKWIADPEVDAIITTGGTGFSGRDSTPEALEVLFDKYIHGFGEMFRHASIGDIGSSTIQSRAVGGIATLSYLRYRDQTEPVKRVGKKSCMNNWTNHFDHVTLPS